MTNGSGAFLVDTNVLVYAYDPTDGLKRARAIEVLEILGGDQGGALSVQILGEFFNTVTRKIPQPLTAAEAERSLTNYARSWMVYGLEHLTVLEAVRGVQRFRFSYWDGLVWATAKLNGVGNVLSEDFNNGALIEGVRFLNPFLDSFDLGLLTFGLPEQRKR